MILHEKLCETCNKPFYTRSERQRYCTYLCYLKTLNMRVDERTERARHHQKGVEHARFTRYIKEHGLRYTNETDK